MAWCMLEAVVLLTGHSSRFLGLMDVLCREQPILNRYTYQVHLPRNRRNKTCRNPGKFEFLSLLETTHRGRYRGLPLGSFDCSLKYFKRPFHAQGLNIQQMQSTVMEHAIRGHCVFADKYLLCWIVDSTSLQL